MSRPRLNTNYKARRAAAKPEGATQCPQCEPGWLVYVIQVDENQCAKCGYKEYADAPGKPVEPPPYPAHWIKGQLLNVRNNGSTFILTPLEEEFDPRHPERAKFFDNSFDCQQFVSGWYARDAADPRA